VQPLTFRDTEEDMTRHLLTIAGTLALGLSACGPGGDHANNGSGNAQSSSTAPASGAPTSSAPASSARTGSATVGSSAGTPTNGSPYDQPAGTNSKPANGAAAPQ
jgi:hypothetical protein